MERYAIGHQDFKGIIEGGYIYADKTSYIARLIQGSKYYFLGRPRRFGKSLFLSTLEYFFLGERALFKNLYIDSIPWDWETYPVIHLDLNGANYSESETSLTVKLTSQLRECEKKYGIDNCETELSARFEYLISSLWEKFGKQVVVLVDEYEKPMIDAVFNRKLSDRYRETLRGFYGVLKSADKYLRLVFLTGVTKFAQMNVFSALNNLKDISFDDRFAAICGITAEELTTYFSKGIDEFAKKHKVDHDTTIGILKENYDGYHFSEECPDIYNPYSLLNALDALKIESYWASTGTPSMLVKCLIGNRYDLANLNGVTATSRRLMNLNDQLDDPVTLFYQTGYLTIKSYCEETGQYTLGYPNREVEQSFFEYLLPYYSRIDRAEMESVSDAFKRYINFGEAEEAVKELVAFTAGINYEFIPKPRIERHFQTMIYIFASLVVSRNVRVIPEQKTSDGRIDLLIETPNYVYIIEIKRDASPEEALHQIKQKDYALPYIADPRKVFLIGMSFSSKRRRLDGYLVEER